MNQTNGSRNGHAATVVEQCSPNLEKAQAGESPAKEQPVLATRTSQRARQEFKQNRFVILAAGGLAFALLILAFASVPKLNRGSRPLAKAGPTARGNASPSSQNQSLLPVIDSGRPAPDVSHEGQVTAQDLDRTVTTRTPKTYSSLPAGTTASPGTLGSIPPFGEQAWQAPPYQPGASQSHGMNNSSGSRVEREPEVKSSLIYVRQVSTTHSSSSEYHEMPAGTDTQFGLGLPVGSRLRARLESAASTAVRTPVIAVIEYNYERDGEIIVPAGSKAVGHIQEADRSGYMRIEFDSLLMPDGSSVSIQAAATDLDLRPIKGKVEGKNTGKNVLMRSLSGIGQAGALLVGRGGLNQPFSEADVIRERVSSNIGEASDEQISRLAITSRVVVNVSAGTPIYVVLEQSSKQVSSPAHVNAPPAQTPNQANLDQLRQLLQLQEELNQSAAKTDTAAPPQNQ
jgi:hypothetical protein